MLLLLVLAGLVVCSPLLLWMYHIDRAGTLLARGLERPATPASDSLAVAADQQAVDAALRHLEAAIRLRPGYVDAYRMAAQALAAKGAWNEAADKLGQAQKLQPDHKSLVWQRSLLLERSLQAVAGRPQETILPDLASVAVDAPEQSVATPYCTLGDAASCYVGLARFSQPLAALPDGPDVAAEVLFMHPPSSVTLIHPIYADHAVLSFMMGMDPAKKSGRSDGAGFEIWGAAPGAAGTLLFQFTMDAETARRGWVAAQLDLSRWAGEHIELTFRTTGGRAGETTEDWFAWADVKLTSPDAALPEHRLHEALMRQSWADAGLDSMGFMARGDEDLHNGRAESALTWYGRASRINSAPPATSAVFRAQIAHIAAMHTANGDLPLDPVGVHELSNSVLVRGTELQWLRQDQTYSVDYGSKLGLFPGPDPTLGVMWWGGRAVTVVDVKRAGSYRIAVRARNTAPAPTELLIEHDLSDVFSFTLNREDGSAEQASAELQLERGLHLLSVNFLNDGAVNGVDRNAILESIEVTSLATGATSTAPGRRWN